jgi:hypothetical protein
MRTHGLFLYCKSFSPFISVFYIIIVSGINLVQVLLMDTHVYVLVYLCLHGG